MAEHASVQGKKRTMYYERSRPNPVNYASQITAQKNWQKHHVLPCTAVRHSIADVASQAGKEHLDKALKYFTNWNINESHNLIPLPTNKAYQKAYGKKGGKQGPVVSPACGNQPCHQPTSWGHAIYNEKVRKALTSVWGKVVMKVEDHKLDANDISAAITTVESTWKGSFPGPRVGTIENWRKMMQGTPMVHNHFTMVFMAASPI
jgi:hypothetical protein